MCVGMCLGVRMDVFVCLVMPMTVGVDFGM